MSSYSGNKNFLIRYPFNKILLPIKFIIDFLQSSFSGIFRFMNYTSSDDYLTKFIQNNYQKGMGVLDFGSGFGKFANLFDYCDYIGVEINNKYISRARKLKPNYNFLNIDLSENKLDKEFNLVLIYGVLHHIPDNQIKKIFSNILQSLADKGKIYIYEPLPPQSMFNIKSLIIKNLDLGNYIRTNDKLISLIDNSMIIEEITLLPKTDHIRLILKK